MKNRSVAYLQLVKETHNLKNDSLLAEFLGIAQSTISKNMLGLGVMDNETCVKVAIALGIHPTEVIKAADFDRADRNQKKSAWEDFEKQYPEQKNSSNEIYQKKILLLEKQLKEFEKTLSVMKKISSDLPET